MSDKELIDIWENMKSPEEKNLTDSERFEDFTEEKEYHVTPKPKYRLKKVNGTIKLDREILKLDEIELMNYEAGINGIRNENLKEIVLKSKRATLTLCTIVQYEEFNKLELNKKTSILDKIDSSDISLYIDKTLYINDESNSQVNLTKISNYVHKLEVTINNLLDNKEDVLLSKKEKTPSTNKFVLEATLDLNDIQIKQ